MIQYVHRRNHIIIHSPSDCFLMFDLETRAFCFGPPPLRRSSSRSRALGKFCATIPLAIQPKQSRIWRSHTCRFPVPSFGILKIGGGSDANLCEIPHRIFCLGHTSLCCLSCPEISLSVTLLEDAI